MCCQPKNVGLKETVRYIKVPGLTAPFYKSIKRFTSKSSSDAVAINTEKTFHYLEITGVKLDSIT